MTGIVSSPMPWQHQWGANIIGILLFVIVADWAVLCLWPRRSSSERDDG